MGADMQFDVRSELADATARIEVVGELDIATVPRLQEQTEALLAQGPQQLAIDLRELTFIDSSGLSLFIVLHTRSAKEGWTLSLTRPPEQVFSVFRITGADRNLPFVDGA